MAMATVYRRVLPSPPAIDFSSDEGKKLFTEAIQGGTMEGFFQLISNFQTQSEPAYCGLASLAMVLNALAIDPKIKWKGPWRWFDESMLDCCEPLEKVKAEGISFGKVVCLAQCAGAEVQAFRTSETNVDQFRQLVQVVLLQTGTGHFSPIGGYHVGRDMALILDVARFKCPPHWVPLTLLWDAMDTTVQNTGQKRGFMLISRPQRERGLLYTLSCKNKSWTSIAKYLVDGVPNLLKFEDIKDVNRLIGAICESLPLDFEKFIHWFVEVWRAEDGDASICKEEKGGLAIKDGVLKQVEVTALYKDVLDLLSSSSCCTGLPSSFNTEENLQKTADRTCPQGVETLTVANGRNEKKFHMFIPPPQVKVEHLNSNNSSGCSACATLQPAGSNILSILLLALPPETWSWVKDMKLLREINGLTSIENLPPLLQEEVLHLRRQLYLLKKCQENKVDEDLSFPNL